MHYHLVWYLGEVLLQTISLLITKQSLHVTWVGNVALTHEYISQTEQWVCCNRCPREQSPHIQVALGEGCLIPVSWSRNGARLFFWAMYTGSWRLIAHHQFSSLCSVGFCWLRHDQPCWSQGKPCPFVPLTASSLPCSSCMQVGFGIPRWSREGLWVCHSPHVNYNLKQGMLILW